MRHVISVILQNEVGALTRMTGLFSTRGYNIESLNVAPTEDKNLSRVTLVISGSNDAIEQLNSQLSKLVDVVGINNMSLGEHFERELLIIKVKIDAKSNNKIQELSQNFNAEILDLSPNSFTIQLTGEIKIIKGIRTKAGNSIQNQPHELLIIGPQPFLLCLPYGARVLLIIK